MADRRAFWNKELARFVEEQREVRGEKNWPVVSDEEAGFEWREHAEIKAWDDPGKLVTYLQVTVPVTISDCYRRSRGEVIELLMDRMMTLFTEAVYTRRKGVEADGGGAEGRKEGSEGLQLLQGSEAGVDRGD